MHLLDDDSPYDDECFRLDPVGRYVAAAAAAGIDEIGFTDHVYRFAEARAWLDHALWRADAGGAWGRSHGPGSAARDAGLPVRVALEVDYLRGREQQIGEVVGCFDWDYLLGSVHWVAGLAVDWELAPIWDRYPAREVWRLYCEDLCLAAASGIYDSMAHPDLAKVFGQRPARPQALYRQIADAFQASGVCAEVSSAGYRQTLAELYPDPELLAMLRERGVPVTLGSDAHSPERVGRDFPRALGELHGAGYRTLTVFDRRQRRQEVFDV